MTDASGIHFVFMRSVVDVRESITSVKGLPNEIPHSHTHNNILEHFYILLTHFYKQCSNPYFENSTSPFHSQQPLNPPLKPNGTLNNKNTLYVGLLIHN
jgi:hypothetical protein